MKISDLPEAFREVARENIQPSRQDDTFSRRELLEALLNSAGIYYFARTILDFVDAIEAAEEIARIRAMLEREAAE